MAGRSSAQDPNYKLYSQYGGQQKYLAAKKALDEIKKKAEKSSQPLVEANKVLQKSLDSLDRNSLGLYANLSVAEYNHDAPLVARLKAEITKVKAKINLNYTKIYAIDVKTKEAQDKFIKAKVVTNAPGGNGNVTVTSTTPGKGPWNFNAPLVKRSDFVYTLNNFTSVNKGTANRPDVTITRTNQLNKVVELPSMIPAGNASVGDAYTFWTTGHDFGKGTIQMDRKLNTVEIAAEAKKAAEKNKTKFDPNMYGFRFNYNPTTINMSWAGMTGANPVFEAAGLDPAIPMASNLFTGTISFDIVLNRIHDLALLTESGGYIYGENPYPWNVTPEDRKLIVQKGTMYDIEYLFKSVHGYTLPTYKSTLMGTTNDPGWLPVRPVELHLGNKLRYRVRISGLEIVHKIFSAKMVPLLSVVSISCLRYWDGPSGKDPKK